MIWITDSNGSLLIDASRTAVPVNLRDGAGNALTSAARGSERALSVQLVDGSGSQVTSFAGTEYEVGDTAATVGVLAMYTTPAGVAKVPTAAEPLPVYIPDPGFDVPIRVLSDVTDSVTASDGGGSLTVDGGVYASTLDGTGNAVTSHTAGASRGLDVCILSSAGGHLTAFPVTDNSGSLTVDDGGSSLTVDGTVAVSGTVTVADGGGSLTVDVSGTVTVDSELPAAVALTDALANPTAPLVGACQLVWNGSDWERRAGTQEGVLLSSASRSGTVYTTATQTTHARGVIIWLDLSVYGGTTGLTVQLWAEAPSGGRSGLLATWGPRSATAQVHWLELSPGGVDAAGDAYGVRFQGQLPRKWHVTILNPAATTHTYGVYYSLLP